MLPNRQGEEYLALWEEFELGESADAKYAKAIDRIPPLLHNINDDGYGWKKHHIPKEKVLNFNQQRISAGGEKIWKGVEAKLQQAIVDGILT